MLAPKEQMEGLVPGAREDPVAEHVMGRAEGLAERLEGDDDEEEGEADVAGDVEDALD